MFLRSVIDVATVKPAVEVAGIFRLHFADYLKTHHCTAEEFAAVRAIIQCRTAALGGHIRVCDGCGKFQISYNPCNNRNCPKCGAFEKAQSFGHAQEQVGETGSPLATGGAFPRGVYGGSPSQPAGGCES